MVQEIRNIGQGDVEKLSTLIARAEYPNELTLMECIQPDFSGEGSFLLIADINTIIASLSHQENVLATLRAKARPFQTRYLFGGRSFLCACS